MSTGSVSLFPFLNGEFFSIQNREKSFNILNPKNPNEILAVTSWAKEWVDVLLNGLTESQTKYSQTTTDERISLCGALLETILSEKEEIFRCLMLELGRSRVSVSEEWEYCTEFIAQFRGFSESVLSIKKDDSGTWYYAPLGRVLIRTNVAMPFYSLLSLTLTSLVAGNVVCLIPSIQCALSASIFCKAMQKAKMPKGVVQVIYGDIEVFRRISLSQQFDTVFYAGGEESLEQVRRDLAINKDVRLCLASGGKNAVLVLHDSDVPNAVLKTVKGALIDAGQRHESTGLVFAHEAVFSEFKAQLISSIKSAPIGVKSDLNSETIDAMGPLCNLNSFERFLRFQGIADREATETLRWGKAIDNPLQGYFVSPGVHVVPTEHVLKSIYATNAFYGPDIALVKVKSELEAVCVLNQMKASRVLSIFGGNFSQIKKISESCNVPSIVHNNETTKMCVTLPSVGRYHSGNSVVSGLHFLYSTVFQKSIGITSVLSMFLLTANIGFQKARADYRKAVEGNEVVKGKIYPRAGRLQVGFSGGAVLNQSFIKTTLGVINATYHFNEWHAVSFEGSAGFSQDSDERRCVENFFWSPDNARAAGADDSCDKNNVTDPNAEKDKDGLSAFRRKPAYMPIRQVDSLFSLSYQWTPVYGKALYFLSSVGYLDFYTIAGLGAAMTTYWPLKNTNNAGQSILEAKGTSDPSEYGNTGRPAGEKQTSATLALGVGNRFYFAKNFLINLELKDYTIFGSNGKGGSDWMNFVALQGGLGVIF